MNLPEFSWNQTSLGINERLHYIDYRLNVSFISPFNYSFIDDKHESVGQTLKVISAAVILITKSVDWASEWSPSKWNNWLFIMITLVILVFSNQSEINHLNLAVLDPEVIRLNILVQHLSFLMQSLNGFKHLQ